MSISASWEMFSQTQIKIVNFLTVFISLQFIFLMLSLSHDKIRSITNYKTSKHVNFSKGLLRSISTKQRFVMKYPRRSTHTLTKTPTFKMADLKSIIETKLTEEFSPIHLVSAVAF